MSKGEFIERCFNRSDVHKNEMRKLMLENGLNELDLTKLFKVNKNAAERWQRLHKRQNRICNYITYTILGR